MKAPSRLPALLLLAAVFVGGLTIHRDAGASDCELACSNYGREPGFSCSHVDPSTSTECKQCSDRTYAERQFLLPTDDN